MWLVVALAFLAVGVAVYAVVARLPLQGNFLIKFMVCGGCVWTGLAINERVVSATALETVSALLFFAFCWEFYIFLFTLISTSVSVGLMRRLRSEALTANQIARRYSTSFMVETRMQRLVMDGFLTSTPRGYTVTPRARLVLRMFRSLRRFFRHPEPAVPSPAAPAPGCDSGNMSASSLSTAARTGFTD